MSTENVSDELNQRLAEFAVGTWMDGSDVNGTHGRLNCTWQNSQEMDL